MKWFQHLTLASDDPDLTALLEQFGPEGYGVFWLIGELVGRNIKDVDNQPEAEMLRATWARKCFVSEAKFIKIVSFLSERGRINVSTRSENRHHYLTIRHEKILKYCDEWIKRLQRHSRVTPDPIRSDSKVTPARLDYNKRKRSKDLKAVPVDNSGKGIALGSTHGSQATPPQPSPEEMEKSRKAIRTALQNAGITEQEKKGNDNGNAQNQENDDKPMTTEEVREMEKQIDAELQETWERIMEDGTVTSEQADKITDQAKEFFMGRINTDTYTAKLSNIIPDLRTKLHVLNIPGVVTRVRTEARQESG